MENSFMTLTPLKLGDIEFAMAGNYSMLGSQDTRGYKIQETLFYVGVYTETLAQ